MEQQIKRTPTIQKVVARFDDLARQEMWFEIQDELFAGNVKSIGPPNFPYFGYAEGKAAVRKKGVEFVKKIQEFHEAYTTHPVIGGNYFAVGRGVEITVRLYQNNSFIKKSFLYSCHKINK